MPAASNQYVTIQLNDIGALLKKEGGTTGALAYSAAPQTVTNLVYEQVRDKIVDALSAEGVSATVNVVKGPTPKSSAGGEPSGFGPGMVAGVAVVGAGLFLYKLISKK